MLQIEVIRSQTEWKKLAEEIVSVFLKEKFEGGRHEKRVRKIMEEEGE